MSDRKIIQKTLTLNDLTRLITLDSLKELTRSGVVFDLTDVDIREALYGAMDGSGVLEPLYLSGDSSTLEIMDDLITLSSVIQNLKRLYSFDPESFLSMREIMIEDCEQLCITKYFGTSHAFSNRVVFDSIPNNVTFDSETRKYQLDIKELVELGKKVAYRTFHNLRSGIPLNIYIDPLLKEGQAERYLKHYPPETQEEYISFLNLQIINNMNNN